MADHNFEAIKLATERLIELGYSEVGRTIEIRAMILYGSRVYGTATDDSDYDFLVIIDSTSLLKEIEEEIGIHHVEGEVEVSVVSTYLFDRMQASCQVRAMESIFTPEKYVAIGYDWLQLKRREFVTALDANRSQTLNLVRSAFSGVSSNSEVKARKKVRDAEYMIGLKSLFHSIRLLMFGVQIGETGEIFDFEAGKECWAEIVSTLIPKIEDGSLSQRDCREFHKKWAKTPKNGETKHLLTRFKDSLPKL